MTLNGLSPAMALACAVLAALVVALLYRLRDRRRRVTVAFVGLWQAASLGARALRWRERLRHYVSLGLQLTMVALLAVALIDPALRNPATETQHLVVLLDSSASMTAREGSETRWDLAQRELVR